jgi:uncharacterized membrane protein YgcG
MSRARPLLLALAGLLLPIGLALGIYLTSAGSLAAVPTVIEPPAQVARGTSTSTQETSSTESTPTETTAGDDEDVSGKCDEPEHRLDPECDPRNASDDSSGPGSGSNSGSGSSGSGSSGSGGGGGDSSGHGSGDDD